MREAGLPKNDAADTILIGIEEIRSSQWHEEGTRDQLKHS
jgi:hypothetical protein